jgi:PAS domain S-box-containing protein
MGLELNDAQAQAAALAIKVRQPVAIDDAWNDPRTNRRYMKKWGIRSVLVVPLVVRDEALGVLSFHHQQAPYAFDEQHTDFGRRLAASLSLALENARLIETLENEVLEGKMREARIARLTRLYAVLSRVNEAIVRTRGEEALLAAVCEIVADEGGFPLVFVARLREGRIVPAAACGPAAGDLEEAWADLVGGRDEGPTATCVREDRLVVDYDLGTHPVAARRGLRVLAAFPLRQGGVVIGSLTLCAREPDALDADDVQLLEALAADLSHALDAMRQERLREGAEQALRQAEHRLSVIVDAIADGFCALDRELRFTHVNDAALRHFHKTREELIGRGLTEIFPSLKGTPLECECRRALQAGEAVHIEAPSAVTDRTLEIHAYPGPENLTVLFHDVTERSRLQASLQRSEALYRAIARNLPDAAVWVVDPDLRYLVAEGPLVPQLGWARERLEGRRLTDVLADVLDERTLGLIEEPFRRALAGETTSSETPYAGRSLWTHHAPLKDELGRVIGAMALTLDVTERQKMQLALHELNQGLERLVGQRTDALRESVERLSEEVARRSQAEEELRAAKDVLERRAAQLHALALELTWAEERERRRVAEILHGDLQQMLVSASMRARLAEEATEPAARARAIADLEAMLDDAFRASRSLSHDLNPPLLGSGDLRQVLEWLAERMERLHGLNVTVVAPARLVVDSDMIRTLLFRAVQELLLNVVKHAGTREAAVEITRAGHQLRVSVSDKGRGFNTAVVQKAAAAGLGLTSFRERASLLGGSLEVDSSPGKGTSVTIQLPARGSGIPRPLGSGPTTGQPAEPRLPTAQPGRAAERWGQGGSVGVLLVDDHEVVRQGLVTLLKGEADLSVVGEAINGAEAIEMAERLKPDVVLMDVTMPVMDGVEATRRIRRSQPGVRVIGLSVLDEGDAGRRMREAGASGLVSKYEPPERLLRMIRGVAAGGPAGCAEA